MDVMPSRRRASITASSCRICIQAAACACIERFEPAWMWERAIGPLAIATRVRTDQIVSCFGPADKLARKKAYRLVIRVVDLCVLWYGVVWCGVVWWG